MSGQPCSERKWHEAPSGTAAESQHGQFERPTNPDVLPEIVVYQDHDYGGQSLRTNLNFQRVPKEFNDSISSIVVVRGIWRFYRDANYTGDYWDLSVGYYPRIGTVSDVISSFQCIQY